MNVIARAPPPLAPPMLSQSQRPLKALMISPSPFMPDWEGNRRRVRQMVDMLVEFGFEVHFLYVPNSQGDSKAMAVHLGANFHELPDRKRPRLWRWWHLKSKLGVLLKQYSWCNLGVDDWYFPEIGTAAAQIVEREGIQLVLCEYIFYSQALASLTGVVKVIDAHDVFGDRYKMFLELGRKPVWYSTPPDQERLAMARSDFVLAIQADDAAVFKDYGHGGVHTLEYAPTAPAAAPTSVSPPGPLRLCFLGSANDINVSALDDYLRAIHPELLAAGIIFEVVVIGEVCERFKHLAPIRQVSWRGRVANLDSVLSTCDVLVNSVATGTGLPIKVLDGLSNGLHVMATDGGARGLPMRETLASVHICSTTGAWVDTARDLAQRKRGGENLCAVAIGDINAIVAYVKDEQAQLKSMIFDRISVTTRP